MYVLLGVLCVRRYSYHESRYERTLTLELYTICPRCYSDHESHYEAYLVDYVLECYRVYLDHTSRRSTRECVVSTYIHCVRTREEFGTREETCNSREDTRLEEDSLGLESREEGACNSREDTSLEEDSLGLESREEGACNSRGDTSLEQRAEPRTESRADPDRPRIEYL